MPLLALRAGKPTGKQAGATCMGGMWWRLGLHKVKIQVPMTAEWLPPGPVPHLQWAA